MFVALWRSGFVRETSSWLHVSRLIFVVLWGCGFARGTSSWLHVRVLAYIFLALWRCGFVREFARAELACECMQCFVRSYRSCVLDNRLDPSKRDAVRDNQRAMVACSEHVDVISPFDSPHFLAHLQFLIPFSSSI